MKLESKKNHAIDIVFVICLLLLFMLSALSVIAIGASIYQKNVASTSINSNMRISFAYVTEKVRQADENGSIYVDEIFNKNVLVLQQELDGELYNTYIYDYDGYLRELFARADLDNFYPQTGQKIIRVNSFDIEKVSGNSLKATITTNDAVDESFYITIRSTGKE